MGADCQTEIARLRGLIDSAAAAAGAALRVHPPPPGDDEGRRCVAEHAELCRQLRALRERVARAQSADEDARALRSELATLLFFAQTLQADANAWRTALEEAISGIVRRQAAARGERQRRLSERHALVRRAAALRISIDQTATRIAQQNGAECRRTLPVLTLGDGITVCSITVSRPRRGFRLPKRWLVTLNDARDEVLVRRE